ncbi:MAG: choice-of-anchor J domain-containing protein, partial [Bacteroidetes bacterium]|nr:choice-of-anchor J domain-containing protein [Bacteroidota bacterium]
TLAYKKTGAQLETSVASLNPFSALPSEPAKWRQENIILTPYIINGQPLILRFRNVNAWGNNLYLDDINVSEIVPGNDAGISAITAPAATSTTACVPVTPVVTIQNNGTTVLTSAMININLNGTLVGSQSWSGSLNPNATASVTLGSVPVTPAVGSNTLKIYTTLPNGVADVAPENDTATSVFTRTAGVAVPVIEGFENATFPSTGWSLNPAASGESWARVTNAGSNSSSSIKADFYDYSSGTSFNLTTPFINVAGEPVIKVSFDVAHRTYPGSADRLQVQVTNDCGASWTTVYDKTSTTGLATGAAQSGAYTPSSSSDWRKDLITLTGSILSSGIIQVRFIATSDFGNNLYVDNINIDKQYARDIAPTLIVRPNAQECTAIFSPSLTIKNNGLETVTSYKAGYKLNGNAAVTQTFTTPLAPGATTTVTLPLIAAIPGTNTIKMFTADPVSVSGSGDQLLLNDTLSTTFAIPTIFPNVIEGFEGSFPPANWTVLNPDDDAQAWVKHTTGRNSTYSAFIDNYNYPTFTSDQMKTPVINTVGADSIIISFDVAHKDYPGSNDVLEVLVSNDCGATFTSVYSKSGPTLATAGESTADYTAPAAGDWRRERVAVGGGLVSTGSIIVEFQNTNGYGNNIFIDNVNIIPKFKRDAEMTAINTPLATTCTTNSTPSVKITNVGSETITAVNISYSIDNGAAVTTNVTGLNIASGGTSTVSLTAATMAVGTHTFKVYSWAPVTSSGTGDQYTPNDTLSRNVYVTGTVAAPITEGFEGGTFPPANWGIGNPDGALTWKTASVGKASASSAYMNDFNYTAAGQTDALFTPTVTYSGVDSVFLKFDVSAVTKSYPGSTETALDTLEVLLTQDCGNSFTTLYKKWGYQLQTVQDPNYPKQLQFTPATDNLWRTDSLDLTAFANSSPIQVVFRTTNNHENNIYLDNVNLFTKTLPDRLKNDGYLILPNPFNTTFGIWHYQQPTNLRYISVYNSVGQLVWKKTFSGNADKYISIDLSNRAAGVYIVQMGYDDVN